MYTYSMYSIPPMYCAVISPPNPMARNSVSRRRVAHAFDRRRAQSICSTRERQEHECRVRGRAAGGICARDLRAELLASQQV